MTCLRNKFHTSLPVANITKGKKMFPRITAYYFTVYKHVCPPKLGLFFTTYYHKIFHGLKMALATLPTHKFARPPMIAGKRCKYASVMVFILAGQPVRIRNGGAYRHHGVVLRKKNHHLDEFTPSKGKNK
jgi:hypothetical protein